MKKHNQNNPVPLDQTRFAFRYLYVEFSKQCSIGCVWSNSPSMCSENRETCVYVVLVVLFCFYTVDFVITFFLLLTTRRKSKSRRLNSALVWSRNEMGFEIRDSSQVFGSSNEISLFPVTCRPTSTKLPKSTIGTSGTFIAKFWVNRYIYKRISYCDHG